MRRPAVAYVFQDLIFAVVLCVVCGGAALLVYLMHPYLLGQLAMPWPILLWPTYALLYIAAMCLVVLILRLLTGRLQGGRFDFPGAANSKRWMLHMAMLRILNLPTWRFLVYGVTGLRFFALRALGSKSAYACDASADATILDAGLHEIGAGSMLASGVVLTGHFLQGSKLRLSPIIIGKDTMVLAGSQIGPGCEIGDGVTIGPFCMLAGRIRIESGASMGPQCTLRAGVTIGRNAVLEDSVYLQSMVSVGEGARVMAHTIVPTGTKIEADTTYPASKAA